MARKIASLNVVVAASPAYLKRHGEPHISEALADRRVVYARLDEAIGTQWEFTKAERRVVIRVPVHVSIRDGVGLHELAAGGVGIVSTS